MIHREDHHGVTVLRMEHGKVNAVDAELLADLERLIDELSESLPEEGGLRALVLTGTGKSFSAGVNLQRVTEGGADYVAELLPQLDRSLRRLYEFPRPTIAAINGHAIAGGLVLALACDRRVAVAEGARLGLTELPVGVPFPVAAFEVVRAALPPNVVHDLVFSGRLISSARAHEIGAVDELVPASELEERALEMARTFGGPSSRAYAATKRLLQAPVRERIERHAAEFDARAAEIWSSPESRAHVRAFLEALAGGGKDR